MPPVCLSLFLSTCQKTFSECLNVFRHYFNISVPGMLRYIHNQSLFLQSSVHFFFHWTSLFTTFVQLSHNSLCNIRNLLRNLLSLTKQLWNNICSLRHTSIFVLQSQQHLNRRNNVWSEKKSVLFSLLNIYCPVFLLEIHTCCMFLYLVKLASYSFYVFILFPKNTFLFYKLFLISLLLHFTFIYLFTVQFNIICLYTTTAIYDLITYVERHSFLIYLFYLFICSSIYEASSLNHRTHNPVFFLSFFISCFFLSLSLSASTKYVQKHLCTTL